MTAEVILLLVGSLFVLIAISGGGFTAKEISIPVVPTVPRILSGFAGVAFLLGAFGLLTNFGGASETPKADSTAQPAIAGQISTATPFTDNPRPTETPSVHSTSEPASDIKEPSGSSPGQQQPAAASPPVSRFTMREGTRIDYDDRLAIELASVWRPGGVGAHVIDLALIDKTFTVATQRPTYLSVGWEKDYAGYHIRILDAREVKEQKGTTDANDYDVLFSVEKMD